MLLELLLNFLVLLHRSRLPSEAVQPPFLEVFKHLEAFKRCADVALRDMVSWWPRQVVLMVGLNDLKCLFQPK